MTALDRLLKHCDLLRAQHRAGIVPPDGQVQELFDLAADVRCELATGQLTSAPIPVGAGVPPQARLLVEFVDAAGQVVHRLPVQGQAAPLARGLA